MSSLSVITYYTYPMRKQSIWHQPFHIFHEEIAGFFWSNNILSRSGKIVSPKWKSFKGLRLLWRDKIRLNNAIWRAWFIQCKR